MVCGLPTSKSYYKNLDITLKIISAGLEMKATPSNFLPCTI